MTLHTTDPFLDPTSLPVADRGPWLATSSGGMWSIHHPATRDVDIRDIAAGLSRNCRYNGQLVEECDFLSVSEHSTLMAEWAVRNGLARSREDALAVLLHDASEAFFGDMVTPVKNLIPDFKKIENLAQSVIIEAFGIGPENVVIRKEMIKLIDTRIRIDERDFGIAEPARTAGKEVIWADDPSLGSLGVQIRGLNPREARKDFLETFLWCIETLPARDQSIDNILEGHAQNARTHLAKINCAVVVEASPQP
ncbi:hypothetical protein KUV57_13440 [Epibacterium sp. DP7N7-1]|nr:hypothetical protein [Epibacterium sp. DP7N7-1]